MSPFCSWWVGKFPLATYKNILKWSFLMHFVTFFLVDLSEVRRKCTYFGPIIDFFQQITAISRLSSGTWTNGYSWCSWLNMRKIETLIEIATVTADYMGHCWNTNRPLSILANTNWHRMNWHTTFSYLAWVFFLL